MIRTKTDKDRLIRKSLNYFPGMLMISVYSVRAKHQGPTLLNDDRMMQLFYEQFALGKITLFEYLFSLHNGSTYVIPRLLYLVQFITSQNEMVYIQRTILFALAFYILLLLQRILMHFQLKQRHTLLITSILGLSHTYFQLVGSILGYLGQIICITLFLKIVSILLVNEKSISIKLAITLFFLLSISNSASLVIVLSVMILSFLVFISKIHFEDELKRKILRENLFRIAQGTILYWVSFILQNLFSSFVGRKLAERNDLEGYNSAAQVGISSLQIVSKNVQNFFAGATPVSPYSLEYGHGGTTLFLNSITVNLLNWLIPSHISYDLQPTFSWVTNYSLAFYFLALFIIFKIVTDRLGLLLLVFLSVTIIVSEVPLYLMRGDSFAWYHVRYQLLLPFISVMCIGRALVPLAKVKFLGNFLTLGLVVLLIFTGMNLISAPRF
jgi:hypothetical protein